MGLTPPQSLRFDFKNIDQLGVRLQQRFHSSKPCHTDTNFRKSHGPLLRLRSLLHFERCRIDHKVTHLRKSTMPS
jgi:hypothetical protein